MADRTTKAKRISLVLTRAKHIFLALTRVRRIPQAKRIVDDAVGHKDPAEAVAVDDRSMLSRYDARAVLELASQEFRRDDIRVYNRRVQVR